MRPVPTRAVRSGARWDPEEVLPAYAALRHLIELHRPTRNTSVEIIDGEHGFYTVRSLLKTMLC